MLFVPSVRRWEACSCSGMKIQLSLDGSHLRSGRFKGGAAERGVFASGYQCIVSPHCWTSNYTGWHTNATSHSMLKDDQIARDNALPVHYRLLRSVRHCTAPGRHTKVFTPCQPVPKYRTKGCSRSFADSPGARTLVFAAFEPFP